MSFVSQHDDGGDLGVEHQVAAVAEDDDHLALGLRELDAEPAGDLVAHAREAVLDVIAAGRRRAPQLVQLPRQRAGGADHDVARRRVRGRALHRADHLGVAGSAASRRPVTLGDAPSPALRRRTRPRLPTPRPARQPRSSREQRREARACVGHQRQRSCLPASKGVTLRPTSRRLRGTACASRW